MSWGKFFSHVVDQILKTLILYLARSGCAWRISLKFNNWAKIAYRWRLRDKKLPKNSYHIFLRKRSRSENHISRANFWFAIIVACRTRAEEPRLWKIKWWTNFRLLGTRSNSKSASPHGLRVLQVKRGRRKTAAPGIQIWWCQPNHFERSSLALGCFHTSGRFWRAKIERARSKISAHFQFAKNTTDCSKLAIHPVRHLFQAP